MNTLAANILIDVSNNGKIITEFTNISRTVFNGNRRYCFEEPIPKLKELTFVFDGTKDKVASYGSLELQEHYTEFFMPGRCNKSTDHYTSVCSDPSLYCRHIVAAIAYFVECFNEETNSSWIYPIKIKYKDYEMNLNTLEDIIAFIKYEG